MYDVRPLASRTVRLGVLLTLFLSACAPTAPAGPAAPPQPTAAPATSAPPTAAVKPAPQVSPAAAPKQPATAASPSVAASPVASPAAATKPLSRVNIAAQELTPVPDPTYSFHDLAKELGFLDKHGIEMDIKRGGGAHSIKVAALLSGEVDIAVTDIIGAMSSVYEGTDLRVIFVPSARYGAAIAANKKYTAPEQLKDQQVGVPTLAGSARFLASLAFKSFGVEDGDVKWIAVGPLNEALPALISGRTEAAVLTPLAIPLIASNPEASNVHIVVDNTAKFTPPFPNFVIIARNEWLQKNPEAADRYVAMMLDLSRELAKDPGPWAGVATKLIPTLSREDAVKTWQILTDGGLWAENGGINLAGTQAVLDTYFQIRGDQPNEKLSKAADVFNTGSLKKALDQQKVIDGSKDVPDWYRP